MSSTNRLSACLIVRDSARTLRPCLESLVPWVDELIVVDTGSLDDTVEIAKSFGAHVTFFDWCDDFSAARNASLCRATGDWLLWIDSDDVLPSENGKKIRQLVDASIEFAPMAYVMQVHCPLADSQGSSNMTVVDHVKMFRNRPELRFEGRIHEQILPAIRRLGGSIEWTDIFVVHANSDQSEDGKRKKLERDLRILGLDLRERPDHPFVLFNLGMTYSEKGECALAVDYLQRSISVAPPEDSHVPKAWALLIANLMRLEDFVKANGAAEKALALFPDDPELLFRGAMISHHFGDHQRAIELYRAAMADVRDRRFSSIDPGIRGAKARHNLALVFAERGQWNCAELQWREILREQSGYAAARRGLAECLIQQKRFASLNLEIDRFRGQPGDLCDVELLQIQLLEAVGQADQVTAHFQQLLIAYPNRPDVVRAYNSFLARQEAKALSTSTRETELAPDRYSRAIGPAGKIKLSLCMIARDSSRTIADSLASIAPWVDEMIVVDTGSTDDTKVIAERFGARVFEFPWCDDFSAARNASIQHARGEWIFWMDSDDTIDSENGAKLRELASRDFDESVLGFVVQVHCPGPNEDDLTVVDHVKMFKNRRDIKFAGRIHEQVLPSLQDAGGTVVWADMFVVHSGCDHSADGRAKKHARDLRLLHIELFERPCHAFTLFNLGMTYTDMEEHRPAIDCLTKSIRWSQATESHLRKAYALLAYNLRTIGKLTEANEACGQGLAKFPNDPELCFRRGVILHGLGRFEEAVSDYRNALRPTAALQFRSIDVAVQGLKARHNLAITLTVLGRLAEAEVQWREIARARPSPQVLLFLAECLIAQKKFRAAIRLADQSAGSDEMVTTSGLIRNRIAEVRDGAV